VDKIRDFEATILGDVADLLNMEHVQPTQRT
jgi:hypothetical protein